MTKRDKRLKRIRQNPKNVSFDDLEKVLGDYGFERDRSEGSHHIFVGKVGGEEKAITVPFNRPVGQKYVKDALKLIDQVTEERKRNDAD